MRWRKAEHQLVELECDGSRCPEHNVVVYPEIIGTGEIKVGVLKVCLMKIRSGCIINILYWRRR